MEGTKTDVAWLICTGKRTWRSQAKARRWMKDHVHLYGRQTPYRCDVCGKWHLTKRYNRGH